MLTEIAPPLITTAIEDEIARHMRLPTGFAGDQRAEIGDAFQAAIAELETALGLCLFPRLFRWRTCVGAAWTITAPRGPVEAITSFEKIGAAGGRTVVGPSFYRLEQSETRTRFVLSASLQGDVEIVFEAGFGANWFETPPDLRRAVLMLTAHRYDHRHDAGDRLYETPRSVAALIRPWRPVRLSAGIS